MVLPSFTIVDGLLAMPIVLSLIRGIRYGMLRELTTLLTWIGAFAGGFLLTPTVLPLIPEVGLFGDYADSCLIGSLLAFLAAFLLSLAGVSLLASMFTGFASNSFGAFNLVLGMLFGLVRGVVVVIGGFLVYEAINGDRPKPEWLTGATSYPFLESSSIALRQSASEPIANFLGRRIEDLTAACHGGTALTEEI